MTEDDLVDLVRWRNEPHVFAWFPHRVADVAAALERYGARLAGRDLVRMWIAEIGGVPVGYVQSYPVSADDDLAVRCGDPQAVAFDYLIGEPDLVDRGLGTEMVDQFCRDVLVAQYPEAPRFIAAPDVRNHASIRVLEKCGFTQGLWIRPEGTDYPEVVCSVGRDIFEVTGE